MYNGCYGDFSCEKAHIREVDGGCFHKFSCYTAGYSGDGYVKLIKDACIGVELCEDMGGHNQSIVEGCRESGPVNESAGSIGSNGSNGYLIH